VLSLGEGIPAPFTRHPAFPVFIANVAGMAGGLVYPAALQLGEPIPLPPYDQIPSLQVERPDGEPTEFFAERPDSWVDTTIPGFYRLAWTDLEGLTGEFSVGVNAGDLDESNITPRQYAAEGRSGVPVPAERAEPVLLAPYLLALAAVLLVLEGWLAWR
jgi:hypothetical protein